MDAQRPVTPVTGASSGIDASTTDEVVVVLTLHFQPGTLDHVLETMAPSARLTRSEEGNNQFDLFRVTDQPDRLVVFERWKNRAALEAHWQLDYTKEVLALFEQNLVAPPVDGENVLYLTDAVG